jgi:cell division protein FtsL
LNQEALWKTLGLLVLIGALLLLYLVEVSEVATTQAHIRELQETHLKQTRYIHSLVLDIARNQAPQAVRERARSLGMDRADNPDYLVIDRIPKPQQ